MMVCVQPGYDRKSTILFKLQLDEIPYKGFHPFKMGTFPVNLPAGRTEIEFFIKLQDIRLDQM